MFSRSTEISIWVKSIQFSHDVRLCFMFKAQAFFFLRTSSSSDIFSQFLYFFSFQF